MRIATDSAAKEIALRRWVLPECLHAAVAAVDEAAIERYIGAIECVLSGPPHRRAFLVNVGQPPPIDARFRIFRHPNASALHVSLQVWVHVDYSRYRAAYSKAFPGEDIAGKVMSHCMNRRMAALKGFEFVRIVPVSRGVNSSSGFSEQWGVALRQTQKPPIRPPYIQYADLAALMVMLDMSVGGGVMDAVNEAQKLVTPVDADG
ncbi:MAG: hypothetical protein WDZ83_14620 [Rhizobiaceae bacterium]